MRDPQMEPALLALLCGVAFSFLMAAWSYRHHIKGSLESPLPWLLAGSALLLWTLSEALTLPSPEQRLALLVATSLLAAMAISYHGGSFPSGRRSKRVGR